MPEQPSPYETIIGLEVHVQLSTASKAFAADPNQFGGDPNTLVSPITLAHPGTLPRANKAQIEAGIKLGLALGSTFPDRIVFDRKNYFYTDLPKGYQITQDRSPICRGGTLPIRMGDTYRDIRIHHVHLEEDAGKSIHNQHPAHSLIDLNRAGVPLLEIVTEPDLRSGDEVDAFMSAVRQLVRYLGISDGHMERGSLRCDVNISVRRKGETAYGPRCEVKNLNSMRFARQAVQYEFERQTGLLERGEPVISQTRNFHPADGTTSPLRSKEEAPDYRYFPEPDLPPLDLDKTQIDRLRAQAPPLPRDIYRQLRREYQLPANEARIISDQLPVARFFLKGMTCFPNARSWMNLLVQTLLPRHPQLRDFRLQPEQVAELLQAVADKSLPSAAATDLVLPAWQKSPQQTLQALIDTLGLQTETDAEALKKTLADLLVQHPAEVAAYRKGNRKLVGFFMGRAMQKLGKKTDPTAVRQVLTHLLEQE